MGVRVPPSARKLIKILLKITKKKISKTESSIDLILENKDYINIFENKLKDLKKRVNLKGFRPGMVPIQLIKKMYGKSVLVEEINKIISEKINSFIKDEKIKIIGEPIAKESDIDKIDINNLKNIFFKFHVGHLSDFKVGSFSKKNKYLLHNIKVENKVINETIENLKVQYADVNNIKVVTDKSNIYSEIRYSEKEHKGLLDMTILDKSESKKIIGKKLKDTVIINLKKLAKNKEETISQILGSGIKIDEIPTKVSLKIDNIIERSPAVLNTSFFDKIFGPGKIKNKKEFNSEIKKSIEFNYMRESEFYLNKIIENELISKNEIHMPSEYVKEWVKKNNDEETSNKIINEQFDDYCNQIKWSYIVDDIVNENKLSVENNEIQEVAKNQIEQQLISSGMQNVGKDVNKFVENYLKHNNGENYLKILNQIKSNKVFNLIKEKSTITNKSITFNKFKSLASKI
tara:strand:+ start:115 stop:1494 length:1380 start_codon:yes stop_codon:yes gene_type:complete